MRIDVIRKCVKRRNFLNSAYSTYAQRTAITSKNPVINAFVHVSEPPSNLPQGLPLSGMTVAVKDNIATASMPTTCSSAILKNFVPPFDATVVKILQDSGADIIGKTNCDEFGMGSLNIHSVHGPVRNPINASEGLDPGEERSAGGSSGGSAAAVAAGLCDAALGTDTGGSVRLPASYCGVVGFKPSYGLISRWGVVSYADSLDCVGVLANDVITTSKIFDRIAVYDDLDPTSAPIEIRQKAYELARGKLSRAERPLSILDGLKIGVPQEYFPSEMSSSIIEPVRVLIGLLKSFGASIYPVSLPSTPYALSSYYVLASAEASSNLARYDGIEYGTYTKPSPSTNLSKTSRVYAETRTANFGQEVQKRMLLGTYALSADAFDNYFLQAQRIRQLIKDDFNRVFSVPNYFSDSPGDVQEGVDVLLHPSAIRTAPLLSESKSAQPNLDSYVQDVLTVPASLGGLPALSIPVRPRECNVGVDEGLRWPIGVSVIGQWGTDDLVLSIGKAVEAVQLNSS